MRNIEDIMNAENWNPNLRKASTENKFVINAGSKHKIEDMTKTDDSMKLKLSTKAIHAPKAVSREAKPSEEIKEKCILCQRAADNKMQLSKTDAIRLIQPKPSSTRRRHSRRRIKRSNDKSLLILLGLLLTIFSIYQAGSFL